jgi:hypothetical protein
VFVVFMFGDGDVVGFILTFVEIERKPDFLNERIGDDLHVKVFYIERKMSDDRVVTLCDRLKIADLVGECVGFEKHEMVEGGEDDERIEKPAGEAEEFFEVEWGIGADGPYAFIHFDGEIEIRQLTDFLDFVFEPGGIDTGENVRENGCGVGIRDDGEVGGITNEGGSSVMMQTEGANDCTLTRVVVNGDENETCVARKKLVDVIVRCGSVGFITITNTIREGEEE